MSIKYLNYVVYVIITILLMYFYCLPATRWVMSNQIGYALGRTASLPGIKIDYDKNAAGDPSDFPLQLASAVRGAIIVDRYFGGSADGGAYRRITRLRDLAKRFPNNPSVYASLLSFEAIDIPENRPDLYAGERLDPGNAYFPIMTAYGCFVDHRDSDALEAIHRAAQMALFEDYKMDEITGKMRQIDIDPGTSFGLAHLEAFASVQTREYGALVFRSQSPMSR